MKKRERNTVNALAAYQIFGGVLGIGLAAKALPRLQDLSGAGMVIVFFAGLLYVFSILCGFILFKNMKRGLNLSLLNQALQVLSVAVGSFAYNYVAGFKAGVGIDFIPVWQLKLNLSLSSFQFFLNAETGKMFIGINLLALLLVYLIERLKELRGKEIA